MAGRGEAAEREPTGGAGSETRVDGSWISEVDAQLKRLVELDKAEDAIILSAYNLHFGNESAATAGMLLGGSSTDDAIKNVLSSTLSPLRREGVVVGSSSSTPSASVGKTKTSLYADESPNSARKRLCLRMEEEDGGGQQDDDPLTSLSLRPPGDDPLTHLSLRPPVDDLLTSLSLRPPGDDPPTSLSPNRSKPAPFAGRSGHLRLKELREIVAEEVKKFVGEEFLCTKGGSGLSINPKSDGQS